MYNCIRNICRDSRIVLVWDMNGHVILYADYSVLLTENWDNLQWMLNRLYTTTRSINLKNNVSKSKVPCLIDTMELMISDYT